MIKSIESTGKTREDAVRAALRELGLHEDDVYSVEMLVMPKSGFLGIGAVPAKVRVSYDDGRPEPKPAPAPKAENRKPAAKKPSAPKAEAKKAEAPRRPPSPSPNSPPAAGRSAPSPS